MFTTERSGRQILPAPDATNLVIGRREGEGIVIFVGQEQVVIFAQECKGGKVGLKISATKAVTIERLRGSLDDED